MLLFVRKEVLCALAVVAAKNDTRYYLNGICFMPGGRVAATDGHRLLVVDEHDSSNKGLTENMIFSIPSKIPAGRWLYAAFDAENGLISFLPESVSLKESNWQKFKDLRVAVGMTKLIDGNYPDVMRLVEKRKEEATDKIGFNAKYLNDTAKLAKFINPRFESVTFSFSGATGSALALLSNPWVEAKYIVMPCRI